MKNVLKIMLFVFVSFGLFSCDEISQYNTSKDGEIVWVGNGIEAPFQVRRTAGVVANFEAATYFLNPEGRESFLVQKEQIEEEVAKEASLDPSVEESSEETSKAEDSLQASLSWVATPTQFGNLLELQLFDHAEADRFEVLSDGRLFSAKALASLKNRDVHFLPLVTERGSIVYLADSGDLIEVSREAERKIASNVVSFQKDEKGIDEKRKDLFARFESKAGEQFLLDQNFEIQKVKESYREDAFLETNLPAAEVSEPVSQPTHFKFCLDGLSPCLEIPVERAGWNFVGGTFDPYSTTLYLAFNREFMEAIDFLKEERPIQSMVLSFSSELLFQEDSNVEWMLNQAVRMDYEEKIKSMERLELVAHRKTRLDR